MNWWALGIVLYLIIDQIVDHSRRIGSGIKILDWTLANDQEFIEELSEAIRRSYVREMQKKQQAKLS